jgi:transposase
LERFVFPRVPPGFRRRLNTESPYECECLPSRAGPAGGVCRCRQRVYACLHRRRPPPEVFGTFTAELHRLRDWLRERGVKSVAMEATGVYWLPLYGVLEAAGCKVSMVNGRQTRNLPGRKTDMMDCQWGATLHAHGLLQAGFVPPATIRRLQDYLRLRGDHLTSAATSVQHQQKALERMNVKLHDVISSLVGASGLRVIEAILAGEREPERLLALCDVRIQNKKAERVKESLRGAWAEEHLFALRQAVENWRHYQAQIAACDRQIEAVLRDLNGPDQPGGPKTKTPGGKRGGVNAPQIEDLHRLLVQLCGGKDVTVLPAHTDYSLLLLIGEVGTDLSQWRTEKHFTAWLGVAPGCRQSGKRRGSVRRNRNRAGHRARTSPWAASTAAWPRSAAAWWPSSRWPANSRCSSGGSWSKASATPRLASKPTRSRCSKPGTARSNGSPRNWARLSCRRRPNLCPPKTARPPNPTPCTP